MSEDMVTLREFLTLKEEVAVLRTQQQEDRTRLSLVSGAQRKLMWMVVSAVVLALLSAVVGKGL